MDYTPPIIDYTPALIAGFVMLLLAVDVVEEYQRGYWHGAEVGAIVLIVLALVWWWSVKINGGG